MTLDEKIASIKVPEPPTDEELYENAQRHLKFAAPTYLENLPDSLRQLSIAQSGRPLSEKEVNALLSFQCPETFAPDAETLKGLERWIDRQLLYYPNGVYVKLGSRSPKDAYPAFDDHGFKVLSGHKAIVLLGDSCRVCEDLLLAKNGRYQPWIFLREWKEIPSWTEFRCFMKGRKLIGISQYFYGEAYPEIEQHASTIEWGINRFFDNHFRPVVHVEDVVFDVFVSVKERHSSKQIEVKLLEINPYGPWTDPCLFAWHRFEDFQGQLKYRRAIESNDQHPLPAVQAAVEDGAL